MANSYSRIESGTLQRILKSELRYREEDVLFAQGSWDHAWEDEYERSPEKVRHRRPRGSSNSGISTTGTRRSSMESATTDPQTGDVVPASPDTPLLIVSSSELFGKFHTAMEGLRDISRPGKQGGVLPAEPESQSLKPQRNEFRGGNQVQETAGPLERYLAQAPRHSNSKDTFEGLEEDWKRLRTLRASLLRRRAHVRGKRRELHNKQSAKSSADEAFMKYVRTSRSTGCVASPSECHLSNTTLDALFEAMQAARDEYGLSEYDYNILEDSLDEEEFELAILEGHLYTTRDKYNPSLDAIPAPKSRDSHRRTEFVELSTNAVAQNHSSKVSYLSKLGDLDLAKERHQNMMQEQHNLILMQESRIPLGIELHENEKVFLAQFPARETILLEEIKAIEADVEQWRAKCLAEGLDIEEIITESSLDSEQDMVNRESLIYDREEEDISLEDSKFPSNMEPRKQE